jgi:hypothetical protein
MLQQALMLSEVNTLLDEQETIEQISQITGIHRSTVGRHRQKHWQRANASLGGPQSPLGQLCARIERLLDRAEMKGNWRAILELSRQLTLRPQAILIQNL